MTALWRRSWSVAVVMVALGLAACGSGATSPATVARGHTDRYVSTVTLVLSARPASLDPAGHASLRGDELTWPVYTGLVSFRHAAGRAGLTLVPGLATALPTVSDGGLTYQLHLRHGLRFSNGRPVTASDFVVTVQRAIANPGNGVRQQLIELVQGAAPLGYGREAGRLADLHQSMISGIVADNATGAITIHLRRADPSFEDLLASPALGLVPSDTPPRADPGDPPPGVGPYRIIRVRPDSLTLQRNPYWRAVPGIPAASVDIDVRISPNREASALAVVNDVADVLDPNTTIPSMLAASLHRLVPGRFAQLGAGAVQFIFLDRRRWPFTRRRAREAVLAALDETTLVREGAGTVIPRCAFAPPVLGHSTTRCVQRPSATGSLSRARMLVRRSGTFGATVALLSPPDQPQRAWIATEAATLRAIGYLVAVRVVSAAAYRRALADPADRPATGVACASALAGAPWSLASIVGATGSDTGWSTVTRAVTRHADVFVIGVRRVPRLTSVRIAPASVWLHPQFGLDLASLRLR